jgi:hypothetical protein
MNRGEELESKELNGCSRNLGSGWRDPPHLLLPLHIDRLISGLFSAPNALLTLKRKLWGKLWRGI